MITRPADSGWQGVHRPAREKFCGNKIRAALTRGILAGIMSIRPPQQPLTGWRSQAWSLVLFVALLRGLLPHAALAGLLDNGNPQLAWCAPGKAPVGQLSTPAAHAACVCAPAGEALTTSGLPPPMALPPVSRKHSPASAIGTAFVDPPDLRARGPPLALG